MSRPCVTCGAPAREAAKAWPAPHANRGTQLAAHVTPGAVAVNAVHLVIDTADAKVILVDCATKHAESLCAVETGDLSVTLTAIKGTLYATDLATETTIAFHGMGDRWRMESHVSRYTAYVFLWRVPDRATWRTLWERDGQVDE